LPGGGCPELSATRHYAPQGFPYLTANGILADQIPAKLEGITLGPDVKQGRTALHTLWLANDNDFLTEVPDDNKVVVPNPNQFFVFGFTDADLAGSRLVPQQFRFFRW